MKKKLEKHFINKENTEKSFVNFKKNPPFDHCVVDNFLIEDIAKSIESEFLDYNSKEWYCYKNAIEDKKALNNWNLFPKITYQLFNYLNSSEFTKYLSTLTGVSLYADPGLNGGGWHFHSNGGNLNPHLDYSIHQKL